MHRVQVIEVYERREARLSNEDVCEGVETTWSSGLICRSKTHQVQGQIRVTAGEVTTLAHLYRLLEARADEPRTTIAFLFERTRKYSMADVGWVALLVSSPKG